MKNFEEITCTYGGHKLYGYYQYNESQNNLVLIPGSYTDHSIWKLVIEKSDINANIFLAELPGFGKSKPKNPDGTIEEFAVQILKLVEAAGINRFFIGGHSIGGMIAIEAIDTASDRIDGVISCEGWTHSSVQRNAFKNLKNETLTEEQLKLRAYYGSIARTDWTDEEIRVYSGIWSKWQKGLRLLENAVMPVLEIWGDRGMMERPGLDMLQIPIRDNIELVWIKNGGHSMLIQYPDLVGQIIAEFIGRVSKNGDNQL